MVAMRTGSGEVTLCLMLNFSSLKLAEVKLWERHWGTQCESWSWKLVSACCGFLWTLFKVLFWFLILFLFRCSYFSWYSLSFFFLVSISFRIFEPINLREVSGTSSLLFTVLSGLYIRISYCQIKCSNKNFASTCEINLKTELETEN